MSLEQEPAPQFEPDAQAGQLTPDDFASGGESAGTSLDPGVPSQPQAVEPPSLRSLISNLGYQAPEDIDDYNLLVNLTREANEAARLREQQGQADLYAQLGRQLAPKAQQVQQFLQQQQPAQRKSYEPPEFNEQWTRLLKVDESTGRYIAVHPNVPQAIVDQANDWSAWTQNFMRNPMSVFQAFAEDRETGFQEKVNQAVQAGIRQYQTQQQVRTVVEQNAPWIYARDQGGNYLPDPVNGGYRVSPLGQRYVAEVRGLAEAGVQDPMVRDRIARQMLASEISAATAPTQQQPPAELAANRQAGTLRTSRPQLNPLQAMTAQQRAQTPGATDPRRTLSLREELKKRMVAEGITDEHFMTEGAFAG